MGTAVGEIVRQMGISEATFYRWKHKFDGLGVVEVRRLKQLVAELSLDKSMLQDALKGKV